MEFLDVVDESGNPTGETVSRSDAHRKGIAHRTSHVWIIRRINERVQILLQKRSMQKESFPGKYDTSSAGHIPAGFEPVGSALRELEEELGIRAEREQLESIGTIRVNYQRQFHGSLYIDIRKDCHSRPLKLMMFSGLILMKLSEKFSSAENVSVFRMTALSF